MPLKDSTEKGRQKARTKAQEAVTAILGQRSGEEEEGPEPKPKRLNVNLDPALYRRFKRKCQQEDRQMSEVVREMVEAYLSV